MTTSAESIDRWVSAHLHFAGPMYGAAADRVLADVVVPFVRQAGRLFDRHFVVRYSEHGPHIRLRLRATGAGRDSLRQALIEHIARLFPAAAIGEEPPGNKEGEPGSVHTLRWVPYTPEIDRYGGESAIVVAEKVFESSSNVAYALLGRIDHEDRAARLGKALLTMLVALHVFLREPRSTASFARVYGATNLRNFAREEGQHQLWQESFDAGFGKQSQTLYAFTGDVWDRLDQAEPMLPELDRFRDDLVELHAEFAGLASAGMIRQYGRLPAELAAATACILPSYIHMMNNRLGITIPEEAYLAHLIRCTFETSQAASVG